MAVEGFGIGSYEEKEERVVPAVHTAYRRFRFVPIPVAFLRSPASVQAAWDCVTDGGIPLDYLTTYYSLSALNRSDVLVNYVREAWGPSLVGTTMGEYAYGPGEHTAVCGMKYPCHDPSTTPERSCECGFWAYHDPAYTDEIGLGTEWTCFAAVHVWGKTVLGTMGVRARKMKIIGLVPPEELQLNRVLRSPHPLVLQAWDNLAKEIGVPVYETREELLKAHPPQDVSHLLPKPEPKPYVPPTYIFDETQQFPTITGIQGVMAPLFSLLYPTLTETCCMCGYVFTANKREVLNRLLAMHVIQTHWGMTMDPVTTA
jgi:hypothetical protein